MKKVFSSHSEVVHTFAQRTHSEGRSGNIFFEGNKIYSYGRHYCMGEFTTDLQGNECIIINNAGYSSSTSKHLSILRSATRQYKQYFTTDFDLGLVRGKILYNKGKLLKAKKPELYINEIIGTYEKYVNNGIRNVIPSHEWHEWHVEITEIYNSVKSLSESDTYKQTLKDKQDKEHAKEKQLLDEALTKFRSYEVDRLYLKGNHKDYLRISLDKTKVETSQGVRVSIESAKVLFKLIQKGVDIKGHHIDNYTVTSINGVLTIGCHKIDIDDVENVGNQIINL